MFSIKYLRWLLAGVITLWSAMGCSLPYSHVDSASTSPEERQQESIKKIII